MARGNGLKLGRVNRTIRGLERRMSAVELLSREQERVNREQHQRLHKLEKDVKDIQEK